MSKIDELHQQLRQYFAPLMAANSKRYNQQLAKGTALTDSPEFPNATAINSWVQHFGLLTNVMMGIDRAKSRESFNHQKTELVHLLENGPTERRNQKTQIDIDSRTFYTAILAEVKDLAYLPVREPAKLAK